MAPFLFLHTLFPPAGAPRISTLLRCQVTHFEKSRTVCRTGTIRTRSGKADFSRCRVVCLDNTKYCLRQTPCTGKKSALRDCKAPQGERFSGDFVRAECRQYTVLSSDGCAKAPKRYVLRRVRIVPARHLLIPKMSAFPSIRALLRGAFERNYKAVKLKLHLSLHQGTSSRRVSAIFLTR